MISRIFEDLILLRHQPAASLRDLAAHTITTQDLVIYTLLLLLDVLTAITTQGRERGRCSRTATILAKIAQAFRSQINHDTTRAQRDLRRMERRAKWRNHLVRTLITLSCSIASVLACVTIVFLLSHMGTPLAAEAASPNPVPSMLPTPSIQPVAGKLYWRPVGRLSPYTISASINFKIPIGPVFSNFRKLCDGYMAPFQTRSNLTKSIFKNIDADRDLHSDARSLLAAGTALCAAKFTAFSDSLRAWVPEEEWKNHPELRDYKSSLFTRHDHMGPPDPSTRPPLEEWEIGSQMWTKITSTTKNNIEEQYKADVEFHRNAGNLGRDRHRIKLSLGDDKHEFQQGYFKNGAIRPVRDTRMSPNLRRGRRQILTGILSALGIVSVIGSIGSLFGMAPPSGSSLGIQPRDISNVLHIQEHELENLHNITLWLQQRLAFHQEDLLTSISAQALTTMATIFYDRVDNIIAGMADLLHGKLNTRIVDPDALRRAYDQVAHRLEQLGAVPVPATAAELYALDVGSSFIIDSLSLHVFVNVPGSVSRSSSRILQFTGMPIETSPGSYLTPIPDKAFLAVSPHDNLYRELDAEDLLQCAYDRGVRICDVTGVALTETAPGCLVALYTMSDATIRSQCRFHSSVPPAKAVQVTDSIFHFFSPIQDTVTVTCPGYSKKLITTPGINEIYIPELCSATAGSHSMTPTPRLSALKVSLELRHLNLDRVVNASHLEAAEELQKFPLFDGGRGILLDQALKQLDEASDSSNTYSSPTGIKVIHFLAMIGTFAIAALALSFFLRSCNLRYLARILTCSQSRRDREGRTRLFGWSSNLDAPRGTIEPTGYYPNHSGEAQLLTSVGPPIRRTEADEDE